MSANGFFEALGLEHHIDEYGNIIAQTVDSRTVLFPMGQNQVFVDGLAFPSHAPQIIGNDIFIPIRYTAELLGNIELFWHDETRTLFVNQTNAVDTLIDLQQTELPLVAQQEELPQFKGHTFRNGLLAIFATGIIGSVAIAYVRVFKNSFLRKWSIRQ
jgi:hypothetical protein